MITASVVVAVLAVAAAGGYFILRGRKARGPLELNTSGTGNTAIGARALVTLAIDGANVLGGDQDEQVPVLLHVVATNDGSPTPLRDWGLTVIVDGRSFSAVHQPLTQDIKSDSNMMPLLAKDALDVRYRNTELISGGQDAGLVGFVVLGVPKSKILSDSTAFALSVRGKAGPPSTVNTTLADLKRHGGQREGRIIGDEPEPPPFNFRDLGRRKN